MNLENNNSVDIDSLLNGHTITKSVEYLDADTSKKFLGYYLDSDALTEEDESSILHVNDDVFVPITYAKKIMSKNPPKMDIFGSLLEDDSSSLIDEQDIDIEDKFINDIINNGLDKMKSYDMNKESKELTDTKLKNLQDELRATQQRMNDAKNNGNEVAYAYEHSRYTKIIDEMLDTIQNNTKMKSDDSNEESKELADTKLKNLQDELKTTGATTDLNTEQEKDVIEVAPISEDAEDLSDLTEDEQALINYYREHPDKKVDLNDLTNIFLKELSGKLKYPHFNPNKIKRYGELLEKYIENYTYDEKEAEDIMEATLKASFIKRLDMPFHFLINIENKDDFDKLLSNCAKYYDDLTSKGKENYEKLKEEYNKKYNTIEESIVEVVSTPDDVSTEENTDETIDEIYPIDDVPSNDEQNTNEEIDDYDESYTYENHHKPKNSTERKKVIYAVLAGVGIVTCLYLSYVVKRNPISIISNCVSVFKNLLAGNASLAELALKLGDLTAYFGSIVASIVGVKKLSNILDKEAANTNNSITDEEVISDDELEDEIDDELEDELSNDDYNISMTYDDDYDVSMSSDDYDYELSMTFDDNEDTNTDEHTHLGRKG